MRRSFTSLSRIAPPDARGPVMANTNRRADERRQRGWQSRHS
jgi:hypothetical protein